MTATVTRHPHPGFRVELLHASGFCHRCQAADGPTFAVDPPMYGPDEDGICADCVSDRALELARPRPASGSGLPYSPPDYRRRRGT